jgi:hypothetical protein
VILGARDDVGWRRYDEIEKETPETSDWPSWESIRFAPEPGRLTRAEEGDDNRGTAVPEFLSRLPIPGLS